MLAITKKLSHQKKEGSVTKVSHSSLSFVLPLTINLGSNN
jgi:hypothetical protein